MSTEQTHNEFPRGIEVITGTIIRNQAGKLLLVTSPKWKGKWVIPGGHVEPGETIMESAIREAKEETGLSVKPVTILYFRELIDSPDFHRKAHFISFLCVLEADTDVVQLETRELRDYQWVLPEEALLLQMGGGLAESIQNYIDFAKK
jgi:nucleoside triphosphatase